MHPSLTIYTEQALSFINPHFTIEKLDDTCAFSEGPVWCSEGFYLFSDIPANHIYKLLPGEAKTVYIESSGGVLRNQELLSEQTGSNGLAYDASGALYICQHGAGAVARYAGGKIERWIEGLGGKPLNSPNDIVVHRDGTIYLSDPPYGLKDQQLNPSIGQERAAFYAWRQEQLLPFCTAFQYPNGLCLSPDGRRLYVGSSKPFEAFILQFNAQTLEQQGTVANENCDGLKCDRSGNLYLCTKEGIVIINTAGERLAKIELDTVPANCCWGGAAGNDLFITARQHIFLIRDLQK